MIVNKEFDKEGRVIKIKISHSLYSSIWTYEYQGDIVIEKRSDSFWTKITNHGDKTSKLIYPDKKEYTITYGV
jgi:ribosomal protein L21E